MRDDSRCTRGWLGLHSALVTRERGWATPVRCSAGRVASGQQALASVRQFSRLLHQTRRCKQGGDRGWWPATFTGPRSRLVASVQAVTGDARSSGAIVMTFLGPTGGRGTVGRQLTLTAGDCRHLPVTTRQFLTPGSMPRRGGRGSCRVRRYASSWHRRAWQWASAGGNGVLTQDQVGSGKRRRH